MKKKGFTLVELIAVVAILSIILVMFVPSLLNSINNNKNEVLNKIYDLIETGARNYVMDYNINTPTRIELEDLCNTTYIECPIINPVTEEELGGYIFVNDDYHYSKVNETFITVDLNGGESAQTFNSSYEPGNVIELIEPTKVNNVFKGWKVVKGNSGIRDNKLIVGTTETVLWAEWGIKELINLTVDLDGGSINENPSGDYELGTIITLDSPTKENYRFTGWEVVEGNSILSGSTLTIGINSTKIKALWELNTYTITYSLDGGILGESAPFEGTYGSTVTISDPIRDGYTFMGWTVSGDGAALSGTSLTIGAGNIILTAKWELLYTYIYNYGTDYTWNNTAMNPARDCESSNRSTLSVKTNSDGSLKLTQSKDYSGGAYTVKVDLTNYSSVVLEGSIPSGSHWGIWSAIPKQDSCDDYIGDDRVKSKTSAGTIDVSSLKGSYYIGIYVYKKQDTVSATLKTLKLVK